MNEEPNTPTDPEDEGIVQPVGSPETVTDAQVEAYDLDGDGKISLIENERARLGIVDARLEQVAEHGGVTGALADAAHRVLDRFDNDDNDDNDNDDDNDDG